MSEDYTEQEIKMLALKESVHFTELMEDPQITKVEHFNKEGKLIIKLTIEGELSAKHTKLKEVLGDGLRIESF